MNKFDQLLQQAIRTPGLNVVIKKDRRGLLITFQNERRQRIEISHKQDHHIMSSVILNRKQVEVLGRTQVLARLWQRNRSTNVVNFSLDQSGQLIGQIEQCTDTTNVEELAFYIDLLARECDRFEYVLTGKDLQ